MNLYYGRIGTHLSLVEVIMVYLKRSTAIGLLSALLIGGACTASQESGKGDAEESRKVESQADADEMVDVTIRLPDGRVIVRRERKNASRYDGDGLLVKGERPPMVAKEKQHHGEVVTLSAGVSGGSAGTPGGLSKAGGSSGGGGGGSAGGGSSGGGSGSSRNGHGDTGQQAGTGNSSLGVWYSPPPNVHADNDYTVRMYAWENAGAPFEHVMRTYIADPRSKTPRQLARKIASEVDREHPEKIAIRFWKELLPASRDPFDISNPVSLINSGGFTQGMDEYWDEFARELARINVQPDILIFDQENGLDYWHIPREERAGFFRALLSPSAPLTIAIPDSLRAVTVEQLMNYRDREGTIALNAYSTFASEFRAAMLKRVFGDAFDSAFGVHIPISNYRDINMSFTAYTYTNRPFSEATVGGISAPVAYLDPRDSQAPRYIRTEKDQRWNRFIDLLNRCRSAAANGLVTPWISAPGYGIHGAHTWAVPNELPGEYRIWEQMMDHMLAMGIDTFVVWNPGTRFNPSAVQSDAFMDQWLDEHPVAAGPLLGNLPEIPLDADQVVTNGVVTTYQEFMDAMNNRVAQ
ncbi:MAG: hypothetical protein ACWA5W_05855 [Phycisphaerales bacterium]